MEKKVYRLFLFLFSFLLFGVSSCTLLTPDRSPVEPVPPHGECQDCHNGSDPGSDGEFCLICHFDYQENHHPINFVPPDKDLIILDILDSPLFDGKIQCLTCHQVHNGTDLQEMPGLLRGGRYPEIRNFCFRCHYQERYEKINVHKMHEADGSIRVVEGKIVCLYCHSEEPTAYLDRTFDVKFKADAAFLCWRCHPPMGGEFFRQHFLKKPSPEMRFNIYRFEQENTVLLPLVPRGKITCSTCHNPHQYEVMITEASRAGADARGGLRSRPPQLCIACHPL